MVLVRNFALAVLACLLSMSVSAQDTLKLPVSTVTLDRPATVVISKGKPSKLALRFHVAPGFHINSNKPHNETLVPTVLKLDPPTDVIAGRITYPPGENLELPFLPGEKLSVYTGAFTITGMVSATQSIPLGTFKVRGQLKYQACNDRQCFPSKILPLDFNVKVQRAAASTSRPRRSPGQSPHIRR